MPIEKFRPFLELHTFRLLLLKSERWLSIWFRNPTELI